MRLRNQRLCLQTIQRTISHHANMVTTTIMNVYDQDIDLGTDGGKKLFMKALESTADTKYDLSTKKIIPSYPL